MVEVKDDKQRIYFGVKPQNYLSIDDAQIAVISWIYAKYSHAELVFCIEDIHSQYSSELYINKLVDNLKWLGIDYKKTVDEQGSELQFRQSERLSIYQNMAKQLVTEGKAYRCYCKPKSIRNQTNGENSHYYNLKCNSKCYQLSSEQRDKFEKGGIRPRVYLKVDVDQFEIDDPVQGKIEFTENDLFDFIILREDGKPTKNFAVAVDMHALDISFRFQPNNQRSNSMEQHLIIEALGEPIVKFAHISNIKETSYVHLQNHDLRRSIDYYRNEGYLPQALVEWLATFDLPGEFEYVHHTLEQLITRFTFDRDADNLLEIDQQRLDWINSQCIKESDLETIVDLAKPFLKKVDIPLNDMKKVRRIVEILSKQAINLAGLAADVKLFFRDEIIILDSQSRAIIRRDNSQKVFWSFLRELKNIENLTADVFRKIMQSVQKETGIIGKDLWLPIRIALTGKDMECELPMIAELLGKAKCEKFITNIVQNMNIE